MSSLNQKNSIAVVALVLFIRPQQKYLIMRRNQKQSGAGSWEFPGGKVESGETFEQALHREIVEEVGLNLVEQQMKYLMSHEHHYGEKRIHLHFYMYELQSTVDIKLIDHDDYKWCSLDELQFLQPLSLGDVPVIQFLKVGPV